MYFSIIIPTCNRNESLKICLESLYLNIKNFESQLIEVIVSDDGALNQAKPLIEEYFSWVTWVEGAKNGPAANRNKAAKIANGKWLIFLDDDCIPDPFLLKAYYDYIIENPLVQIFEGCIKPDGPPKTPLDYAPINETGGHLWSCNFCIKKELFQYCNGFDEAFKFPHLEDVDLLTRIRDKNLPVLFSNNAFVVHPWRRFTDGKKLALFNEMDFYFARKHSKQISVIKTFIAIVHVHFSMFVRNPQFRFFLSSLKVGFDHSFYFLLFSNKWKKKYFK